MDRDALFVHAQGLLRAGLVTLVGSGASAARGLPTMSQLAEYVLNAIEGSDLPVRLSVDDLAEWQRIAAALRAGSGLETAIRAEAMSSILGAAISHHVATAVQASETIAIEQMISADQPGPFATLVRMLMRVDANPSIVTTNYDRLIEVDLALDGIVVDSMFVGSTIGHFDETSARQEHERLERAPGRTSRERRVSRQHVRLSKPHGSLDWMEFGTSVVKTDLVSAVPRRVIAPGGSKYRLGYETPFEEHRARANAAFERASALLVVGYGFNDDHLETRLRAVFSGTPALVVAYELTPKTRELLATSDLAVGVEAGPSPDSCRVFHQGATFEIEGAYWQLATLVKEAF